MALPLPYPDDEHLYIHITADVTIDREDRVIIVKGKRIYFPPLEYAVINCLVETYLETKSHRLWCSPRDIAKKVYTPRYRKDSKSGKTKRLPEPVNKEDAVRKIICHIRKRIADVVPDCPDFIECRPGHGYRLRALPSLPQV